MCWNIIDAHLRIESFQWGRRHIVSSVEKLETKNICLFIDSVVFSSWELSNEHCWGNQTYAITLQSWVIVISHKSCLGRDLWFPCLDYSQMLNDIHKYYKISSLISKRSPPFVSPARVQCLRPCSLQPHAPQLPPGPSFPSAGSLPRKMSVYQTNLTNQTEVNVSQPQTINTDLRQKHDVLQVLWCNQGLRL